jgi:hypothetical protein
VAETSDVLAALASPDRLRLFARVVLAGDNGIGLAELEAGEPGATRLLPRLLRAGLLARGPAGRLVARPAAFRVPDLAGAPPGAAPDVSRLFRNGRLTGIPARQAPRSALLAFLAGHLFEPGRGYPEAEVNAAIGRYYSDFATLRRYLVDEGLLVRSADGSCYQRS